MINPYEMIHELFAEHIVEKFKKHALTPMSQLRDHPPHIYAIAAQTYKELFETEKKQAIVISGESGAGKTENAKFAMKFLTSFQQDDSSKETNETSIEQKVFIFFLLKIFL